MAKKKIEAPPVDPIERDFLDAFTRLQSGTPKHKKLKESAARGILKINPSTVALEAGHSRTLIGTNLCRYPRVRDKILGAKKNSDSPPSTYTELIDNLRGKKAELARALKLVKSEVLEHFNARVKAEKVAAKAEAANARLVKQLAELGKVTQLVPKDGE
jgi:hypothetical protein